MRILALDTSTAYLAVALCEDDRILAETTLNCDRRHTECLLQTVTQTLESAGIALIQIDALAVSIGPGSFTGLRVGVAACKGLALGANLPLIGVSSLESLARCTAISEGLVCPVLDAKMSEVFAAVFEVSSTQITRRGEERVCTIESFTRTIDGDACFLGDGAILYHDQIKNSIPGATILGPQFAVPRASAVAAVARDRMRAGCSSDPANVTPLYLRMSQAEEAKAAGRAAS